MRLLVIILAALALAAPAAAVNLPDPRLDQVATAVAGHPVTAWCETDDIAWNDMFAAYGDRGELVQGFTFIGTPVIYLSPKVCLTLRAAIYYGYREAGLYWFSGALLTLVHESVHQRGIPDEGVTDCTALSLLPSVATLFWGFHAKRTVRVAVPTWKVVKRKVRGVWVRVPVRTVKVVTRKVADPDLPRLVAWATAWHEAKPAEYQGTC